MEKYYNETSYLVAVDCVIFGFDGNHLKLLLIKRGFEPEKGKWSVMGGFVKPDESLDEAAERILLELTGLKDVYMEQIKTLGHPKRDPVERTMSVVYFALIDIQKYQRQIIGSSQPGWFSINMYPTLIFDHNQMVELSKESLRYKAANHPLLFELLPEKFTLTQLQDLYEDIYDTTFDKRNFRRKILSLKLLIKLKEKDKTTSKKGSFLFKLDKKKYQKNLNAFLNLIPKADHFF